MSIPPLAGLCTYEEAARPGFSVAENVASARVLAKLGMRLEGRLREKQCMKGRWWDTLVYAILEHEWHRVSA